MARKYMIEMPAPCPCGGPLAVPADAILTDGFLITRSEPKAVYRVHADACEVKHG